MGSSGGNDAQIRSLKNELDRDVESQKNDQIRRMKEALDASAAIMKKKQKALHVLLKFSICREAITRVRDAQQHHYEELEAELEARSTRLNELTAEKNRLESVRTNLRGELKTMRVGGVSLR